MRSPGQVVLFPFPHADLKTGKLRPALLLAKVPNPYDDWLICMISSQLHHEIAGFDEAIRTGDRDFGKSGLKRDSLIRISRLAVVEGGLVAGAIGTLSRKRLNGIKRRLASWIKNKV